MRERSAAGLVLVVLLPFACGYFLSFLLRSTNAVVAPFLVRDVGLGAEQLGLVTAAFFIGFAAVQIPLGVLLDRVGARRVQAVLFTLGAAGCVLFGLGESLAALTIGRCLMGVGMAAGLMAAFKAAVQWFPPERLSSINGAFLAVGGLGAISATAPLAAAVELVEWRWVFVGLGAVTLAVGLLILAVVPEKPRSGPVPSFGRLFRELGGIAGDPLFLRTAPISLLGMGGFLSLQGLWAGPWLADVAGLPLGAAADRLLVLALAMTLGFLGAGLINDRLRTRGLPTERFMAAAGLLHAVALAWLILGFDAQGFAVWILLGLVGNAASVVYPLLARHFGAERASRAATLNTLVVFGGSFLLQAGLGWIIDRFPRDAAGAYPREAYTWAFGTLLVLLLLSVALLARPIRGPRTL